MDRSDWLIQQIKENNYTRGAEIGVYRGVTSRKLLESCDDLFLYLVDAWKFIQPSENGGSNFYKNQNFEFVKEDFFKNCGGFLSAGRARAINEISWLAAKQVQDGELDFVFIDADHGYKSCRKDIEAWVSKLKPGGLVSGHDIHMPGVRRAVSELIPNYRDAGIDHVWWAKKEDMAPKRYRPICQVQREILWFANRMPDVPGKQELIKRIREAHSQAKMLAKAMAELKPGFNYEMWAKNYTTHKMTECKPDE